MPDRPYQSPTRRIHAHVRLMIACSKKNQLREMSCKINKPAPVFKASGVLDGQFKDYSTADFAGKYHVVFFYPLDFTFVCPTEIIEFSDRIEEFNALNCGVVGVSVDSKFTHLAWTETPRNKGGLGKISYPLLEDLTHKMAIDFGCYMEEDGHTCRGTYIISDKGVVRHISMNDPPASRSVDEVLRLVAAFQFNDVHGEVCPAGWKKKGDATIKGDPVQKMEYFGKKF